MENQNNTTKEEKRTWGAKIPSDLREKIEGITEATGMKGEELLTNLVESFDLNQTKLAAPKFEKDIDSLENYTSGIVSCIKGIVQTAIDMEKINEEKYQKKIQDKENRLSEINQEISALKERNKELDEENMNYWKENRQLEDNLKTLKETQEEQSIKNQEIMNLKDSAILEKDEKINSLNELITSLTTQVEEGKKYQKQITNLKQEISEFEKQLIEQSNETKTKEIEIDGLKSQIVFFKDQVDILKAEYKEEIKELKSSMQGDYNDRIKEFELRIEEVKADKDQEIIELKEKIAKLEDIKNEDNL